MFATPSLRRTAASLSKSLAEHISAIKTAEIKKVAIADIVAGASAIASGETRPLGRFGKAPDFTRVVSNINSVRDSDGQIPLPPKKAPNAALFYAKNVSKENRKPYVDLTSDEAQPYMDMASQAQRDFKTNIEQWKNSVPGDVKIEIQKAYARAAVPARSRPFHGDAESGLVLLANSALSVFYQSDACPNVQSLKERQEAFLKLSDAERQKFQKQADENKIANAKARAEWGDAHPSVNMTSRVSSHSQTAISFYLQELYSGHTISSPDRPTADWSKLPEAQKQKYLAQAEKAMTEKAETASKFWQSNKALRNALQLEQDAWTTLQIPRSKIPTHHLIQLATLQQLAESVTALLPAQLTEYSKVVKTLSEDDVVLQLKPKIQEVIKEAKAAARVKASKVAEVEKKNREIKMKRKKRASAAAKKEKESRKTKKLAAKKATAKPAAASKQSPITEEHDAFENEDDEENEISPELDAQLTAEYEEKELRRSGLLKEMEEGDEYEDEDGDESGAEVKTEK